MSSASAKPKPADARPASSRPTSRQAGSRPEQKKAPVASGKAEVSRMDKEDFQTPDRSREPQNPRPTKGDTTTKGRRKGTPVDQQHAAADAATQRKSDSVDSPSRNPPAARSTRPLPVSASKPAPDQDQTSIAKIPQSRTSQQEEQHVKPDTETSLDMTDMAAISRDHQLDLRAMGARQKSSSVKTEKIEVGGKSKELQEDQDRKQISGEVSQKDQRPVHDKKKRKTPVYEETLGDLHRRLVSLSVSKEDAKRRDKVLKPIIEGLLDYLNREVSLGGKSWNSVNSGSYYDHTQISKPDEFDIMLTCSFRVKTIYVPGGPEQLFCKLQAIDSEYQENPLACFHKDRHDGKMYACPKIFMMNFRQHCDNFIKKHRQPRTTIELKEFDGISPAVTLNINADGIKFAVDMVPSISLKEWPKPAKWWTSSWLPKGEVDRIKAEGGESPNEFPHAVAKIFTSERMTPPGECRLWRISFSLIEKKIFYHSDGNLRSRKEDKTIRKGVLRLLKEKASEFHNLSSTRDKAADSKFSSHFLKNIMLQLYDDVSGWEEDDLLDRYLDGLDAVVSCLKEGRIPHYFIRDVNLLDRQLTHLTKKQLKHYEKSFASEAESLRSAAGLA